MEPEDRLQHTLNENKDCIQDALSLMEKMATLRALLLIKKGAGQRYLQHTHPTQEQLKKAEQAIRADYLPQKQPKKAQKKSSLVQAMNQKGMA